MEVTETKRMTKIKKNDRNRNKNKQNNNWGILKRGKMDVQQGK